MSQYVGMMLGIVIGIIISQWLRLMIYDKCDWVVADVRSWLKSNKYTDLIVKVKPHCSNLSAFAYNNRRKVTFRVDASERIVRERKHDE